jgi:molecular chaperone HscB
MNYFTLIDIPIQLKLDPSALQQTYFRLSRQYHPDYFAQATEQEQEEALEKSALLNKAFQTFKHPDETIKYVLQLKGLLEEEEKYVLDASFLMEVMELNEQLMELEMDATPGVLQEAKTRTAALKNQIYNEVAPIVEHYQEGVTTEKELLQVKAYYYQKKYLDRIEEKILALENETTRS